MKTVLLIDIYNLAWSTAMTLYSLSIHGRMTGVVYTFFRQLLSIGKRFEPEYVFFAADSAVSKRKEIFPDYKACRKKELDDEELLLRRQVKSQIKEIHKKWLDIMNFQVFSMEGYEADDVLANLSKDLRKEFNVIIVSTDNDLYQLLHHRVSIWNNRKQELIDLTWLLDTYGIKPKDWAVVKEIAGCKSDGVPGIPGVGEKTAIKFIKGELNPKSKTYQKIVSEEGLRIRERNRQLVKLPMERKSFEISFERPSLSGFRAMCDELGFKSLLKQEEEWIRVFKPR